MKIAFVIPTMAAGGAERVASILCNQWVTSGHDVHLLTLEAVGSIAHYPLQADIRQHQMSLQRSRRGAVAFVWHNYKRIRQLGARLDAIAPDVLVSFMVEANVVCLAASRGKPWPVVVAERIHPGYFKFGRVREWLRKKTYPWADVVVVQSLDIAQWFSQHLRLNPLIMPNPVRLSECRVSPGQVVERRKTLLAVGRLHEQKAYDVLLQAFSQLAGQHRDWNLRIVGDGPEQQAIEQMIVTLRLQDRVELLGRSQDVVGELATAGLFVHASRYEGFPNAVVEALCAGCCVVATDSPGATSEILADGEYGVLVQPDSVDELAQAIAKLINDPERRASFEQQAPLAVAALDAPLVANRWLELFQSLTNTRCC